MGERKGCQLSTFKHYEVAEVSLKVGLFKRSFSGRYVYNQVPPTDYTEQNADLSRLGNICSPLFSKFEYLFEWQSSH